MSSQKDKSGDSIEDKSRESTRSNEEGTSTPKEQVHKHSEVRFVLSSSDVTRPAKQVDDVAGTSVSKSRSSILKQASPSRLSSAVTGKSNLSLDKWENKVSKSKATEILGSDFKGSTEDIISQDKIDDLEVKEISYNRDTKSFFVDGKRHSRSRRDTIDSPAFPKQSYEDTNIEEQVVLNYNVTYNDEQARWWIIITCCLIWFSCMLSFYMKISTLKKSSP